MIRAVRHVDASRLNRHVAQVVRHVATQLKAERHVDALLPWLDQAVALESRGRGTANAPSELNPPPLHPRAYSTLKYSHLERISQRRSSRHRRIQFSLARYVDSPPRRTRAARPRPGYTLSSV